MSKIHSQAGRRRVGAWLFLTCLGGVAGAWADEPLALQITEPLPVAPVASIDITAADEWVTDTRWLGEVGDASELRLSLPEQRPIDPVTAWEESSRKLSSGVNLDIDTDWEEVTLEWRVGF